MIQRGNLEIHKDKLVTVCVCKSIIIRMSDVGGSGIFKEVWCPPNEGVDFREKSR